MTALLLSMFMLTWSPEEVLRSYLMENYPWPEVEVQSFRYKKKFPDSPPEKIIILKGLPGRTKFLLTFPDGKSIEYSARVKAFDWVLKNKRAIKKGAVIKDSDIYKTLMEVGRIPKGAVTKKENIVGRMAKRSMSVNRVFSERSLKSVPDVEKGQAVLIMFDDEKFSISTNGVAKESGLIGETIVVRNSASNKQLVGTIVGNNVVRISN